MDLDEEILALAGDSPVRSRTRSKREGTKRSRSPSLSDESNLSDASLSDSDANIVKEVQSYGPDLIIDEEDRKYLDGLPEREREIIIAERADKRQILMERLEVKRKLKEGNKNKGFRSSNRHSTRQYEKTEKEMKSDSLSDLKRRREKKRSKLRDKELNEEKRRNGNTWNDSESEEEEEEEKETKENITLEELNSARITRDELEKWVYAPFFNSTIIGCFARLGIGFDSNKNYIYRITQILDVVDYHRTYKINKTAIKKALILGHGKAKKRFGMDIISNGPFTEQEYNRYMAVMRNEQQTLPTSDFIKEKVKIIQKARDHKFTSQEISEMVQEKKQLLKMPLNVAMEKASLILKKEKAEQEGNEAEIENINNQLLELDNMTDEKSKLVDEKLDNWTKLNERNRKMNAIESRKAELQATQEKNKKGRDDFDPFARRKCMPTHVVAISDTSRMNTPEVEEKVETPEDTVPESATIKVNTPANTIKHFSSALIESDDFDVEIDPSEISMLI